MKKYLLVPVLLLISLSLNAREVNFTVQINNLAETSFSVSILEDVISREERSYVFTLDGNAQKAFVLQLDKEEVLTFRYGSSIFQLIVRPSDSPVISFDGYDVLSTLNVSGAASNRAFLELQRRFPQSFPNSTYSNTYLPLTLEESLVQQAEYLSEQEYFAMLDRQQSEKLSIAGGSSFLTNKIKSETATYKLIHILANQYQYTPEQAKSKARNVVGSVSLNDPSLLKYSFYTDFLTAFTYVNHLAVARNVEGEEFEYYEAINSNLSGKARAFMLSKLFYNTFRYGQTELIQRKYADFKKGGAHTEYTSKLDILFGDRVQFNEDGPAPNFSLPDESGRMVSLGQYKGKVIYLSFWATWCKPCLKGFEKSLSIRKELQNMGVILINVSVDRDPSVWKSTMSRVEMPGINLLSSDSAVLRTYDIGSLPVYHIIDKQGNFRYLSEGFRDIREEFQRMINE